MRRSCGTGGTCHMRILSGENYVTHFKICTTILAGTRALLDQLDTARDLLRDYDQRPFNRRRHPVAGAPVLALAVGTHRLRAHRCVRVPGCHARRPSFDRAEAHAGAVSYTHLRAHE